MDGMFENQHKQNIYDGRTDIMTAEQIKRGQYYVEKYNTRRGEVDKYREEFDNILKAYACERDPDPEDPNLPNNFIPLITPVVEGQVAAMMENDVDFIYTSNNPAHQLYLPKIEAASNYCRNWNNAHRHYKDFTRLYDVLGSAWITVVWEKSISKRKDRPDGYPRIVIPSILSVLVDGRIKDYKDLQHAEYIIHEIGFQDIAWARKEYGDAKANAIATGSNRYDGEGTESSHDDVDSFLLLHVWTRNNKQGNLQLIEMDTNGLIFRESDPSEPYYGMVDNEYPFYFSRMIPRNGKFYGYGDGKILFYMQTLINHLADEMELAARFNAQPKVFVDPRSNMDLDQFDSDPSHPVICENPHQTVYAIQGQGINPVVSQMIQFLLDQAQRATRFSDIMSGTQQGVSATATQISGQLSQGAVGIKDKASDIQNAMAWCDRYCMRLCLEKWTIPFWVGKFKSASGSNDKAEFIDLSQIAKASAVIPMSRYKNVKRQSVNKDVNYEAVIEENGEPAFVDLDFDVTVKLAAGIPKGKNDLFNQILSLMQVQVLDPASGQPVPFLTLDIARQKMAQIIGFDLNTDKPEQGQQQMVMNAGEINPLGASGNVAMPQGSQVRTQPDNLASTVPMAMDSRGLQL